MRKKFILLIVATISTCGLFGQNLHLLNSNKLWSTLIGGLVSHGRVQSTLFHKFDGDTTIQASVFKKMFQSTDSLHHVWEIIGFAREDPQTGLYFRNTDGEEGLLYKYNLHINDTFTIVNTYNPLLAQSVKVVVNGIDSVLINGAQKKRIILAKAPPATMYETDTLIEDIGSLQGIMFNCNFLTNSKTLICYYENDHLVYKEKNHEYCYYNGFFSVDVRQLQSEQFKIYPNPSQQEITILFDHDKCKTFSIYNQVGVQLNSFICNEMEYKLDISKYPAGIYYIAVQGQNPHYQKFTKY